MMVFYCIRCGHKLMAPEHWAGGYRCCGACGSTIRLPAGEASASTPPAVAAADSLHALADVVPQPLRDHPFTLRICHGCRKTISAFGLCPHCGAEQDCH